jgi:hypothetical protein
LRRLRQHFSSELAIIGVHSAKFTTERVTENIREAVLRHDIQHPVVNDAHFEIWQAYAVRAWPTVVLIDPQGRIVKTESGEIIEAQEYIHLIENLISEFEAQGELNHEALDLRAEAEKEPSRPLRYPSKILTTPDGRCFVADTAHHRILELQLSRDGHTEAEVLRVFGNGQPSLRDGREREASFHYPRGMAINKEVLYVADTDNHAIRAIDLMDGMVRTIAGSGNKGNSRFSPGHPTKIDLRSPWAVEAIEDETNGRETLLLIAMAGSHQIWLMMGDDRLGIFAGNGREALVDGPLAEASFNQPSDLAMGLGHLFVADAEASAIRAIFPGQNPRVFTLVGLGLFEFGDVDGVGEEARLQHPTGITYSETLPKSYAAREKGVNTGLIYIADSYNHKVKALDPTTGKIDNLFGNGQAGQIDGVFTEASLSQPEGLSIYQNRLYIADTNNHLIRVADLETEQVSTLQMLNMERLEQERKREVRRLPPVQLGEGQAIITLDLQLPEGYALNSNAPIILRKINPYNGPYDEQTGVQTFSSHEPITLNIEVNEGQEVILDLTLYYCEAYDQRLCMIHDTRLVLPVDVTADAPDNVQVPYDVETLG